MTTLLSQLEGRTIRKVRIHGEDSRCEVQLFFTDGSDVELVFKVRPRLEGQFMAAHKGEPEEMVVLVGTADSSDVHQAGTLVGIERPGSPKGGNSTRTLPD